MPTYSITSLGVRYSSYSGLVDGDSFDLNGLSSFIVDQSTVLVNNLFFNNVFQTIVLENTSTSQPIIVRFSGQVNGDSGNLVLDGQLINIGTLSGVPSQTLSIPSDAGGNYPSHIGYLYIDGVVYSEVSSFANMYADFRGRHFTYNSVTGLVTFGDGTNGDTPTGTVQMPNIFVDSNIIRLINGTIRGDGHAVFIDANLFPNFICSINNDWGVVNCSSAFTPNALIKHKYGKLNYVGIGSTNVRMLLGEDTTGDYITFQTESSALTEIVQNVNVPMRGTIENRIIAQGNNQFTRVRLYNNGGSGTLKIYQGTGAVFTPYGGVGGSWNIECSNGYLRTDTSPNDLLHGRYDCDVSLFYTCVGDFTYSGQRQSFFRCEAGKYAIGSSSSQIVMPSGMVVSGFFSMSGSSTGRIDNLRIEGQGNSGDRDYNIFSPNGWLITNVEVPNDTDHGCQPETNTSYQFTSFIGRDPLFSKNMSSSTVVKNAARDQGEIWFLPHAVSPNGTMLSGDDSELMYSYTRVYFENVGTKSETLSEVLKGCENITGLTINGSATGNFTIEYKIWETTQAEPASYQTLSLANVQADTAAFTTATKWYFKYTVEKIAGNADQGYLTGITLDVDLDPSYLWEPEPEPMIVNFEGMQVGDHVRIEDAAGNAIFYDVTPSTSLSVEIDGTRAGETFRRAVDRVGDSPDVGSFQVVAGFTLPVSVSLTPYRLRSGSLMYTASTDPAISVSFDLATPEARITIDNVNVSPQDIFNEVERALVTEDGMAWHSQQGSIVQWDDIVQGGRQLYLGANWRLFGVGLNAAIDGIVASVDPVIFAAGSAPMIVGAAYEEYTQADRDRDDAISALIATMPADTTSAVFSEIIEAGETLRDQLRLLRANAAGNISDDGQEYTISSADGLTDRITGTYTETSRTITTDTT